MQLSTPDFSSGGSGSHRCRVSLSKTSGEAPARVSINHLQGYVNTFVRAPLEGRDYRSFLNPSLDIEVILSTPAYTKQHYRRHILQLVSWKKCSGASCMSLMSFTQNLVYNTPAPQFIGICSFLMMNNNNNTVINGRINRRCKNGSHQQALIT